MGAKKNSILFVNKENVFLTSPVTALYVNYGTELQHTLNKNILINSNKLCIHTTGRKQPNLIYK